MSSYKKLDDMTLQATDVLEADGTEEWGAPRLRRIFNFKSRQVTTIYERGGVQNFKLRTAGMVEWGYTAAVTSSMQIQNFRDIEGQDEIAEMHAELLKLQGRPPPLDDVLGRVVKKGPSLKP